MTNTASKEENKVYEKKRNKLIPVAEMHANAVAGDKPSGGDDGDDVKERWTENWNAAFHEKMEELVEQAGLNKKERKTFLWYQQEADKTAIYPNGIEYTSIGLAGEVGEFCDKLKKVMRDSGGEIGFKQRVAMINELGDILWYISQNARELGASIYDVVCVEAGLNFPAGRKDIFFMENYQKAADTSSVASDTLSKHAAGMVCHVGNFFAHARDFYGNALLTSNERAFVKINHMLEALSCVLWHISQCARILGVTLESVAELNIGKLNDRQRRGVLGGSGDNR